MNVYFISSLANPLLVKIGYASDVSRRLSELQTGNPFRLKVVDSFRLPSAKAAAACEALLHATFSEYRMHGEWFRNAGAVKQLLTLLDQGHEPESAIQLAITAAARMNTDKVLHRNRKQRRALAGALK